MLADNYANKGLTVSSDVLERKCLKLAEDYDKNNAFEMEDYSRKYEGQFFSMYQYRYGILKERVLQNAMARWGDGKKKVDGQIVIKKDKILDISSGQLCWVVGTIYTEMKNKLNILQDVEMGVDDVLPKIPESYVDQESEEMPIVMIEDESGRAVLHNDDFLKKNILVTGCIVAILGIEIQAGIFEIMDVVYPAMLPQKPLPPPSDQPKKIAFVSGLNLRDYANSELSVELLKQYLAGELGSDADKEYVAQISHLVIAGDSISCINTSDNDTSSNNYGSKNTSKFSPESLELFDQFIQSVLPSMPISVMPGLNDPAEICLPQQKMHRSIFQRSKQYVNSPSLRILTNPAWMEFENSGLRFLGTSGQNISDIRKYLTKDIATSPDIDMCIMENTVKWQNIVPTAPDTLYCYPFDNSDPFTLVTETPHVYFAANQSSFLCKTITLPHTEQSNKNTHDASVTLITIPSFSATGQIVLLDLQSLTCEAISISAT